MIITQTAPVPDRMAAKGSGGPKAKDHKGPKPKPSLRTDSPFKVRRKPKPSFTPVENVPMNAALLRQISPPQLTPWMPVLINGSPSFIGQCLMTARHHTPRLYEFIQRFGHRESMIRTGGLCLDLARPTITQLGFALSDKVTYGDVVHHVKRIGCWFIPGETVIQLPLMIPDDKVEKGTDIVFCTSSDQFFIKDAKNRKTIRESGAMPDPRKQLMPNDTMVIVQDLKKLSSTEPTKFEIGKTRWGDVVDPSHRFLIATDIRRM